MLLNLHRRKDRGMSRWLRILVMAFAIVAILGVATGSASPAHFHLKAPAGGCDICFAAHIASFEAKSLASFLAVPEQAGQTVICTAASGYQSFRSRSSLSRGPPTLAL